MERHRLTSPQSDPPLLPLPIVSNRSFAALDVQVVSWYDNEMGYSTRVVDLIAHMAKEDS